MKFIGNLFKRLNMHSLRIGLGIVLTSSLLACSDANNEQPSAAADDKANPAATNVDQASSFDVNDPELIARGQKLYLMCQACHAIDSNSGMKIGPSLQGIVNKPAAGVEGFNYSAALREQSITWDLATLDQWLKNPAQMAPGTIMSFPGIADEKARQAIIAYLSTL